MRRGRPPKPTGLKILEGNRGRRPLNTDEPQYAECGQSPTPTRKLSAKAQALWDQRIEALGASRVLRQTDLGLLTTLVQVECRILEWGDRLDQTGPMIEGEYGPVENPLAKMLDRQIDIQRQLCGQFGFSPSSRSTLREMTSENSAIDEALIA